MASLIPENKAAFALSQVALHCAGRLFGEDRECLGVTTDTRADLRGRLFVALRGERFDGHDFALQAITAGASGVLVERDVPGLNAPHVKVSSTLNALGALAGAHRQRWGKRIVAVAGSAGKTTTRSAITAVLSALSPNTAHFAAGNLNNLIGVPMVLLGLLPQHALGVVEIGTNAPGEVRALSLMAAPDLAVLTLIGLEHSEGLGDLDGIEREEGEIWSGLAPEGLALSNADDVRVQRTLEPIRARALSYGYAENANYRLRARTSSALGGSRLHIERRTSFAQDSIELETSLLGDAGAYASLAALAVGEWVSQASLDPVLVSAALSAAGEPGRLTPVELADGTIVLDDSYNSNPASVQSSLRTAREIASARKARLVLVIGEMRELGALAAEQHGAVGELLSASGAAVLVAIAGDAERFVSPAKRAGLDATFAETAELALGLLLARLEPKDVVLVKASRGVHAERLVRGLLEAKGQAA
jgi:UDP-N-acetylmuramoyl-tripeptide--D-alanyl-D-alanine ligase